MKKRKTVNRSLRSIVPFVIIGALIFIIYVLGALSINKHTTTFTVSGRDRECSTYENRTTCYYVIFTKDGRILTNIDSILHLKFNSGTLQAQMIPGKSFKAIVTGFRVPLFSMKENIIRIDELE